MSSVNPNQAGPGVTPLNFGAVIPPHVNPNELIESAWGNAVVDALQIHENPPPSGRVVQTATVVLSPNVVTDIPMGSAPFLRSGVTLDGAGHLTIPVAGIYLVQGSLGSINGVGNIGIDGAVVVTLNSSATPLSRVAGYHGPTWWPAVTLSTLAFLPAGDWIGLSVTCAVSAYCDPTAGWGAGTAISAHLVSL